MKRFVCAIAILTLLLNMALAQTTQQAGARKNNKESGSNPQAAAATTVTGSGTAGRLSKWTGVSGSSTFVLGDTIITEDKFGKIGIGTATPTSPLTVQGMIETTLGGYKFPDGTLQTTALSASQVVSSLNNLKGDVTIAAGSNITIMPAGNILTIAAPNALTGVAHDPTLQGNGTSASPLGVTIPLNLTGSVPDTTNSVLRVRNTGDLGTGVIVSGGARGAAVRASGGNGTNDGGPDDFGGDGLKAFGGGSSGRGGQGVDASGGGSSSGTLPGGNGVRARGGNGSNGGSAGAGVEAIGGFGSGGSASGPGVRAFGGFSENEIAGDGVVARGGNVPGTTSQKAGDGVVATGGNNPANGSPGHGVVATGGHVGGAGVFAQGSDETSGENPGGDGVRATGGTGSGAFHSGGNGITAIAGSGANGASRGLAGQFVGNVLINGDLNVQGTKNFKIDHPLDPENKYLLHAAIESSEVLNIYSGNVTTNQNGEAIVTLPNWFEAMNKDLRYQLTVIGTFAQAIVAEKVKQNRFVIETNAANVEVSWQVTGVRSDAEMLKHPFKPEEEKPVRERRLSRP